MSSSINVASMTRSIFFPSIQPARRTSNIVSSRTHDSSFRLVTLSPHIHVRARMNINMRAACRSYTHATHNSQKREKKNPRLTPGMKKTVAVAGSQIRRGGPNTLKKKKKKRNTTAHASSHRLTVITKRLYWATGDLCRIARARDRKLPVNLQNGRREVGGRLRPSISGSDRRQRLLPVYIRGNS